MSIKEEMLSVMYGWSEAEKYQWEHIPVRLNEIINELDIGEPEVNGCENDAYICFSWDSRDWHVMLYINCLSGVDGYAFCRDDFYLPADITTHLGSKELKQFLDYYLVEGQEAA